MKPKFKVGDAVEVLAKTAKGVHVQGRRGIVTAVIPGGGFVYRVQMADALSVVGVLTRYFPAADLKLWKPKSSSTRTGRSRTR